MKRSPITVQTAGPPDLEAAAGAMLPLFLAFLDGRLKRPPEEPTEGQSQARANGT